LPPGFIRTDMTSQAPVEEALKAVPAQRIGEPREVAASVDFFDERRRRLHYATGALRKWRNVLVAS